MASMMATGVSLVVFFLSMGLVMLVSDYIVSAALAAIPMTDDPFFREQNESVRDSVRLIMTLLLPATFAFAIFKVIINSASRGRD